MLRSKSTDIVESGADEAKSKPIKVISKSDVTSSTNRLVKSVSGVSATTESNSQTRNQNQKHTSQLRLFAADSKSGKFDSIQDEKLRNAVKSANFKISSLFDSHFTVDRETMSRIISSPQSRLPENSVTFFQELNRAWATLFMELDTLKGNCDMIEKRYKDATLNASRELQQNMNILFTMQQKTAVLDEAAKASEKLKEDFKALKQRLVLKDKDHRATIAELEAKNKKLAECQQSLSELSQMMRGTPEELQQQSIDAKMTNSVMAELKTARAELRAVKDENKLLKKGTLGGGAARLGDTSLAANAEVDGAAAARMKKLEEANQALLAEATTRSEELEASNRELTSLRGALAGLQERLERVLADPTHSDADGASSLLSLDVERELRVKAELREERERVEKISAVMQLENKAMQYSQLSTKMNEEVDELKSLIVELKLENAKLHRQLDNASQPVKEGGDSGSDVESKLVDALAEIRRLYLLLQEARGIPVHHIRVHALVWGGLAGAGTGSSSAADCLTVGPDGVSLRVGPSSSSSSHLTGGSAGPRFVFDKVFGPEAGNDFLSSAGEYVQLGIDGLQSCILCYGQQNSAGKFRFSKDQDFGAIPKLLEQCFNRVNEIEAGEGCAMLVQMSFMRITEERIEDLLSNGKGSDDLELKKNADGSVSVTNITSVAVTTSIAEEVQDTISVVNRVRAKDTSISASHYVVSLSFSVQMEGSNAGRKQGSEGRLYLVDAGASNVSNRSECRSLTCLGELFASIAAKKGALPFRNTKLTFLLQSAFSTPSGRLLVVAGLDPGAPSLDHSMDTLRFASSVSQCIMSSGASSKGSDMRKGGSGRIGGGSASGSSSSLVAARNSSNAVAL